MSEYHLKIVVFAPARLVWPKILGGRGRPTNHSSRQKTGMNELSCGTSFFRFVTIHTFYRETDVEECAIPLHDKMYNLKTCLLLVLMTELELE